MRSKFYLKKIDKSKFISYICCYIQFNRVKNLIILNMKNKKLITEEATKLLLEVNLSNKYDRLKTLYQYVKGGWIDQHQFCVLMEDVFGLKI